MSLVVAQMPSPNFNDREASVPLAYVILHYTDMKTAQEALDRLRDPGSEVSAHYLIDEDGRVAQLVQEDKRAWHAGRSYWRGLRDVNSASIGIELVNPGHTMGYRPFPKVQIDALKALLAGILSRHAIPPAQILGHSDIAPARKKDPGELFPWPDLAAAGFGLWPQPGAEDYAPFETGEVFSLLRQIGYDCPPDDEAASLAALCAFQRHFHPEVLGQAATPETAARMRALVKRLDKVNKEK